MINKEQTLNHLNDQSLDPKKPLSDKELASLIKASKQGDFNALELNKKNDQIKNQFKEIASKIENKVLKFNKESKENGELYGSIKPKEVSSAFKSILDVEINPSQIDLRQEITNVGKYKFNVNLHAEVIASVNLSVDKIDSI